MAGPGDPIIAYIIVTIVFGTPLLWYFTDLGFWISLAVTALSSVIVLRKILEYVRDRNKKPG